jgi:hydroxymethylbilane synthase
VELVFITTQGDVKTGPLGQIGGQGLFTKEIQRALLAGEVDVAVHSLKDLPTAPIAGLVIGAVPLRESTGDAFVSNQFATLAELPAGARVGTGSLRRRTQLLHARADLTVLDIRGNVDTRLRKLDDHEFDAIVLAEAGLTRLGLTARIREVIPNHQMLPAVGQGALGIEVREDDAVSREIVAALNHRESECAVIAERTMLAELRGGCLAPVGAWARVQQEQLQLDAVVLSAHGEQRIHAQGTNALDQAADLGRYVAEQLRQQGADALIATSRSVQS